MAKHCVLSCDLAYQPFFSYLFLYIKHMQVSLTEIEYELYTQICIHYKSFCSQLTSEKN